MKIKRISLIIALMGFALMGVMAMQFYFLLESYQLKSELFDRSVSEALSSVVAKIEKQDAIHFMERMKTPGKTSSRHYVYNRITEDTKETTSPKKQINTISIHPEIVRKQRRIASIKDSLEKLSEQNNNPEEILSYQQVQVEEYIDEMGRISGRITSVASPKLTPQLRRQLQPKLNKYDTIRYAYNDPQTGRTIISIPKLNPLWLKEQERVKKQQTFKHIKKLLEDSVQLMKAKLMTPQKINVIQKLAEEYQKADEPLNTRIDRLLIDSLLRFELQNKGILLPFSYEITTASHDSLIYSNAQNFEERPTFVKTGCCQTPIFTKEVVNDPGMLKISFPEKHRLIFNRMTATMGISGGLLLVLILCFSYTIFLIFRQKKISEMKTEFINNMTHEFKTPVSTIMIASEALKDEEIVQDKARVARLAGIIYDENVRLGSHIERVLNIARIEQDDFRLDLKEIDVNEQITAVVDSMSLKIQKNNATVNLDLQADVALIQADELHFTNVLYNLIDNAIKYSASDPEIRITTKNTDNQLFIAVADKGIGMSRDQQAKIFEQFYRIPTGNLHDVKGFGLGLSYVNTIVKRLSGNIGVRSEKDKGSVFELKFPLLYHA